MTMDQKILVAYATNAGSTAEVAETIRDELASQRADVDLRQVGEVTSLNGYSAVVVGAPMIAGWHRDALRFLRRNQEALREMPVAYFITCVNLTQTDDSQVDGVPVYVDRELPRPPRKPGRLSFRENYATVRNYVRPTLKVAPFVKPVSVGVFGGKLELFRLKFFQMVFAMLVAGGKVGDFRHWDEIRLWAASLRPLLMKQA
jgi:menaquinone-dependent protoporphyrinogen oxidase